MTDKNPSLANIPAPPVELPSFVTQKKAGEAGEPSATKFNPAIPAEKNITSPEPEKKVETENENEQKDELPSMQDIASGELWMSLCKIAQRLEKHLKFSSLNVKQIQTVNHLLISVIAAYRRREELGVVWMGKRHGEVECAAGKVGDWFGRDDVGPSNEWTDLWVLIKI